MVMIRSIIVPLYVTVMVAWVFVMLVYVSNYSVYDSSQFCHKFNPICLCGKNMCIHVNLWREDRAWP